nr:OmpA family protein [uncultured Desulfobacter sp.]
MGTFSLTSTFPGRMMLVLIPLYLILFYYTNVANGAFQTFKPDPETYSNIELETLIKDYRAQLEVSNEQILDTRKDLEWLIVKINRISDSGRSIPKLLHDSVELKKNKISKLERQHKFLSATVEKYLQIYDTKNDRDKSATQIRVSATPDMEHGAEKAGKSIASANLPDIAQAVKQAGLGDWVDVLASDGSCAKINNTLPILFPSGSAALAKEYKSFLKKLAMFLRPYDVKVYVNGYADTDPIHTQKYPSNLELGASRAANVVHEMVKAGLKRDIFKIGSTGQYRFAAKSESLTKNFQRRAQLTVVFSG